MNGGHSSLGQRDQVPIQERTLSPLGRKRKERKHLVRETYKEEPQTGRSVLVRSSRGNRKENAIHNLFLLQFSSRTKLSVSNFKHKDPFS